MELELITLKNGSSVIIGEDKIMLFKDTLESIIQSAYMDGIFRGYSDAELKNTWEKSSKFSHDRMLELQKYNLLTRDALAKENI